MFQRSWVQIPALYTGWTFFTYLFVVKLYYLLEKTKINEKESGGWPIFKKNQMKLFYLRALGVQEWSATVVKS